MNALIFTLLLLTGNLLTAQDFQGVAIYRTSQQVSIQLDSTKHTAAMTKELNEQLSKQFDKEQILHFTKNESMYKEVESLEFDKPQMGSARITVVGHVGQAPLYRNLSSGRFVRQEELMGKRFLVKDTLEKPDWKLENEQKKIGNYTCYKATWTRNMERTNWTKEEGPKKVTVEVTTTAWYTPEIPVSHGPREYWGLPGLILEVQEGKLSYLCTGITLNPKEKFSIEIPDKGKEIDKVSFEQIREEKNREMLEQFQRGKEGGTIKIRG